MKTQTLRAWAENNPKAIAKTGWIAGFDYEDRRHKGLGIIPSFFSMHTFYWGDWHRHSVLGIYTASAL